MQTFNYFDPDGGTYHMKIQKGFYYGLSIVALVCLIATLVYGTGKVAYIGAVFLALTVVMGILRSTGKISFDTVTRQITIQTFFFSSEKIYTFDDFDHFLVIKNTSLFIPLNASAILILNQDGKERRVLLRQSFFVAKPLQRLCDELSVILGLPLSD